MLGDMPHRLDPFAFYVIQRDYDSGGGLLTYDVKYGRPLCMWPHACPSVHDPSSAA